MYKIPEEILRLPYQEIADSPTEKYYTNWRIYDSRLALPDSKSLDSTDVSGAAVKGYCIIDPALGGKPLCPGISIEPYSLDRPPLAERMAYYHYHRARNGAKIVIAGGKLALLLRGGDAYKGYTLKLALEPDARAEVLLVDTSLQGGLKTASIELDLMENSKLDITHLVVHGADAAVYETMKARLASGASLSYRAGGRPGLMSRVRFEVSLEGERAGLDGLLGYSASERRSGDIILNVTHQAPRTRSRIEGRGIARDLGRLVLRGVARVLREAPGSSSHVDMHVIVVGDQAKGRSVPMLEIYTGDVEEASHSASAATVLEDVLFYAATRGLSREELVTLMELGLFDTAGVADTARMLGLRI